MADSGDWVNHMGPWYMPHACPGNPAIGYDNENVQHLYSPSSDVLWDYPGFYSATFHSTDLGESWQPQDPYFKGRETVCRVTNGKLAWACGLGAPPVRRTTDGGMEWFDSDNGIYTYDLFCIDLLQYTEEDLILYVKKSGKRDSNPRRPLFNSQLQSLLSICYKQYFPIITEKVVVGLPFFTPKTPRFNHQLWTHCGLGKLVSGLYENKEGS